MDVGISKNQLLHRQLESAIPLLFSPCTLLSQYLLMESLGFPGRFFPLVPPWVSVKVYFHLKFCSVQSFSCVWLFAIPWTAVSQASLSITNYWSLPKPMSIESVMPSNRLILCHPLLLLPSIFPSIRVFSNESALHIRWPKYWSFSFSIIPSKEYKGLISSRMDWLDLLAVQGTLKIHVNVWQNQYSIVKLKKKIKNRVFSNTIVWKYQSFSTQPYLWSNSYIHTWLLEKP